MPLSASGDGVAPSSTPLMLSGPLHLGMIIVADKFSSNNVKLEGLVNFAGFTLAFGQQGTKVNSTLR